jgi:preprotein translocase subunit SecD
VPVWAAPANASSTKAVPRLQFRLVAQEHDESPWEFLPDPKKTEEKGSLPVLLEVLLDESSVSSAHATLSPQGMPQVEIAFKQSGSARFAEITRRNIGRKLAIVFDGRLLSAPVIQTAVPGGMTVITGTTQAQADALAQTLNALRGLRKVTSNDNAP